MPRDHTEFIQSQDLSWESLKFPPRKQCKHKILSQDHQSGASSRLLHYPPGWRATDTYSLSCDEELYVLSGDLTINNFHLNSNHYAYLPKGFPQHECSSKQGATVLSFFEGQPNHSTNRQFRQEALIEPVDTLKQQWTGALDKRIAAPQVRRLQLRLDHETGESTWLLEIQASEDQPMEINGVEQHPCVEEMYLLQGTFNMQCGTLRKGAYFWRPAMIKHGPMGTRSTFKALFRAKEGSFSTLWSEALQPLDWNADYKPILPSDFSA